jgi:hypothetical protein
MNVSDLKLGDLVRLTKEWLKYVNITGLRDDIKNYPEEIYEVKEIRFAGDGKYRVHLEATQGIDLLCSRMLTLGEDLVWANNHDLWGDMPMIELASSKRTEICGSNTQCPVCGRQAFQLFMTIECSNPNCRNYRE